MNLFFEREETEDEIVVTHKPYFLYVLLGALLLAVISNNFGFSETAKSLVGLVWFFTIVMFIWRFISIRGIQKEMTTAMKSGGITISGSRFNFKDPMIVRIPKILLSETKNT